MRMRTAVKMFEVKKAAAQEMWKAIHAIRNDDTMIRKDNLDQDALPYTTQELYIGRDERPAVKMLFAEYKRLKQEFIDFADAFIMDDEEP